MTDWSVVAAQSGSRAGDIGWNITHHLDIIHQAARHHADLLVFPELSLTGYELPLAAGLAMPADDPRLQVFSDAAASHGMAICVGLPLRSDNGIGLASLTFLADGSREAYAKRHLYGAEQAIFQPGASALLFGNSGRRTALAICADISVEHYAQEAAARGANLYATGVLISPAGYHRESGLLAQWSKKYSMPVLMANHAWPSGEYVSAAKSAFWCDAGRLIVQGGEGEQLIIARRNQFGWQGEVHPLDNPVATA